MKLVGILTSGGDTPGINAAIRGLGKAAHGYYDFQVVGFRDGFRGLMENRIMRFESSDFSGLLTLGGTILGTSRDKPHKMPVGGQKIDMRDVIHENYIKHQLDVLVCIGGGGTQKNALRLMQKGMNVITLPKTIDNDVVKTDITFGFDTAMTIATEAIDRLHSTAHSHHRIIIVETMGHKVGWLALGAGIASGSDVILLPEQPYNIDAVAEAVNRRSRHGKRFSIITIAEGAVSQEKLELDKEREKHAKSDGKTSDELKKYEAENKGTTLYLAKRLEKMTGLQTRVTILGHVQRGGTPSPADRLLATNLGTACAELIDKGKYNVMVAARGDGTKAVPLEEVAGKTKYVPMDHAWIEAGRKIGVSFGDT